MTLNLDDLEAKAKVATPGPWKWWTSNSWRRLKRDATGITQNVAEPYVCRDGHPDLSISEEDMAYIAAANPATMLALVARIRELQREKARLIEHAAWSEGFMQGVEKAYRAIRGEA